MYGSVHGKLTLVQAMTHGRLPERNWLKRGESMSDRLVRFPGTSWEGIEDLPERAAVGMMWSAGQGRSSVQGGA